jgi:multicomponent Na+:H+ antiporter subunit E
MLIFLLLLWIVFNGTFTLEILLFGIAISAVVFFFLTKFMGYSVRKEIKLICKLPFVIAYLFVLLEEIVKANIVCAGLIIKGNRKIEPALVSFASPLKSEMLNTVLANSITLTPGTISVSLKDGRFTVHCLDKSLYEGINDSIFVKLLKRMGD